MKLCKDCRHLNGMAWCHAPQNGVSPIDGSDKSIFALVSRGDESRCGPNAKYWEPKVDQPKSESWWRFWK